MLDVSEINFFLEVVIRVPELKNKISAAELNMIIFPKRKYRITGVYGRGGYGLILKVKSNTNDKTFAIKLAQAHAHALDEFGIQRKFAEYEMAPKLYLYDVVETDIRGFRVQFVRAVMDPIRNTVFQYLKTGNDPKKLYDAFECLIKKKYLLEFPDPFLHCDMHCSNVVILQDGKTLGFIDFGLSRQKPFTLQILDSIPLIMSCLLSFPATRTTLCRFLVNFYNQMFNVDMTLDSFKRHPSGKGYAYISGNIVLHSYDWQTGHLQTPLPNTRVIKTAFPTFRPPRIVK